MRLVAAGAGFCYKPDCTTGFLWHEFEDGSAVKLAQVAHIVAASVDGPRGDNETSDDALVSTENLVLLCPNCHVLVDRAPERYTVSKITRWKQEHERRVAVALRIRRHDSRDTLRADVEPRLSENKQLWKTYGPASAAAQTMDSDAPRAWQREVLRVVIPNNTRILGLLDLNWDLLKPPEREVVEEFRLHSRALEDRHVGGIVNKFGPIFPHQMDSILTEEAAK